MHPTRQKPPLPQPVAQKGGFMKKFDEILPPHPIPRNILILFRSIFVMVDTKMQQRKVLQEKNRA